MVREGMFSYRAFISGIDFTSVILIRKTHSVEFRDVAFLALAMLLNPPVVVDF